MICPVRCYSCGAVIAHKYEEYKKRIKKGEDSKKVLDELGLKRYCCRSMFVGQVDLIDEISKFRKD